MKNTLRMVTVVGLALTSVGCWWQPGKPPVIHDVPLEPSRPDKIGQSAPQAPVPGAPRAENTSEDPWLSSYQSAATAARPGFYPLPLLRRPVYWTHVAVPDAVAVRMDEYGNVEASPTSGQMMPFVVWNGRVLTALDATQRVHSLAAGWAPAPSVRWVFEEFELEVTAAMDADAQALHTAYRLINKTGLHREARLLLAIRPLRIAPPWVAEGGLVEMRAMSIRATDGTANTVAIQGRPCHRFAPAPVRFGVRLFDGQDVGADIAAGTTPRASSAQGQLVSGAADFTMPLAPSGTATVAVSTRLDRDLVEPHASIDTLRAEAAALWSNAIGQAQFTLPHGFDLAFQAQSAYLLCHPMLTGAAPPWSPDSAFAMAALLRLGLYERAREYLQRCTEYITSQPPTPNGLAPCDVTGRWLFMMADYYRFTNDRALVDAYAPLLFNTLAQMELTGLSDRPFGDLFWHLKGFMDGAMLARQAGDHELAEKTLRHAGEIRERLSQAVRETMIARRVSFIPSGPSSSDVDMPALAAACFPCDERDALHAAGFQHSMDLYYETLIQRTRPGWSGSFSTREIDGILAFMAIGREDYAQVLWNFLWSQRHPAGWYVWADFGVCGEQGTQCPGDMPNLHFAAMYILSLRHMFADERGDTLALLPGLGEDMIARGQSGVAVRRLPTAFGRLDLAAHLDMNWRLHVQWTGVRPPGGLDINFTHRFIPSGVLLNGQPWTDFDRSGCRAPGEDGALVTQ